MDILGFINKPFGYVLRFFADICGGNFAAAVLIFTVFINLILIPLSIKSQKSTVQQTRIKPKLDELKKLCGDDKQKYNMEMQKLYQEEGVSMSGGCLPMIIRLLLMMSIYGVINRPLTYLMGVPKSVIDAASDLIDKKNAVPELKIIEAVASGKIESPKILDKLDSIDFNLFGIDLTQTPKFGFDFANDFQWIWLIPIGAFLAQILTSVISMAIQKKNNPEAPSMAGMMLTMPLISLFIGFGLPGGVGFYWICSSLIGGFIQSGIQLFYGPQRMLASYRKKEIAKQLDFENKQIQKLQ